MREEKQEVTESLCAAAAAAAERTAIDAAAVPIVHAIRWHYFF